MDSRTEAELCRAYQNGDSSAFDELYEAVTPIAASFARRMLGLSGRADGADEVVQNAWLRALHSIHRFDPEKGAFHFWFRGIVRNVCQEGTRGRRPKSLGDLDLDLNDPIDILTNIIDAEEARAEEAETPALLDAALRCWESLSLLEQALLARHRDYSLMLQVFRGILNLSDQAILEQYQRKWGVDEGERIFEGLTQQKVPRGDKVLGRANSARDRARTKFLTCCRLNSERRPDSDQE